MTTLPEAIDAMVTALQPLTVEIPGLHIYPHPINIPTPPAIDILLPLVFQRGAGFGIGQKKISWTVRARVSANDPNAAFGLLLRLLDVNDAASVEAALAESDPAAVVSEDGTVSGWQVWDDDRLGSLLGATWEVEMFV